jgi:hypothetical protein
MSISKLFDRSSKVSGKITVSVLVVGILIFISLFFFDFVNQETTQKAIAQNSAVTSVNVRNTPPVWTVDVAESPASYAGQPTNSTDDVTWTATATDANGDPYYLLVCMTNTELEEDVHLIGGSPPTCPGGQWARSPLTNSGEVATATYTTSEANQNINNWWAWICDHHVQDPRCNAAVSQGSGNSGSPFVVNKRPVFTAISNTSEGEGNAVAPGEDVIWTATANDSNNTAIGPYNVALYVCGEAGFTFDGTSWGCVNESELCHSSPMVASNPSCDFEIPVPSHDIAFPAWVYVIDQHMHIAAPGGGSAHATNNPYTVANVAPFITASEIHLINHTGNSPDPLQLTVAQGQTAGFTITLEVNDNNGCETSLGGREISSIKANVFRSGITSALCRLEGHANPNNCYTDADPNWTPMFTYDEDSCTGGVSETWTGTFPLWYVADPTDVGSQFPDDVWLASLMAEDKGALTSAWTDMELVRGKNMSSFLAFTLSTLAIPYGELEAGESTNTDAETEIVATGNVGINQDVYGDDMCSSHERGVGANNGCLESSDPGYASQTIPTPNQKVALDYGTAYGTATPLDYVGSPVEVLTEVPKTTVVLSPQTGSMYWGIGIPLAVTVAGEYFGLNTFEAKISPSTSW